MLKTALKNLTGNWFTTVGNIAQKQDIGIPMGINPVTFWWNLFLHFDENQFMAKLTSNSQAKSCNSYSKKRFINNLFAINDSGRFGRINAANVIMQQSILKNLSPSKKVRALVEPS